MRGQMTYLTCYIEGHKDRWEAICVDLDLAVNGSSLSDTKALLEDAVRSYIQDAMSERPEVARRLLERSAPWHVHLQWRLKMALAGVFSRRDPADFEGRFAVSCPA